MGRLAHATAAASLALAGCAQIFGIDQTSAPADAPGPATATVEVTRMSIGATLVTAPQDLTGLMASFEVPDATDPSGLREIAATQSAMDTWSAAFPDANPEVLYTLPDYPTPVPRLMSFGRAVKVLFGVLEHPGPQPAPAGATITLNVTLTVPYASESLQLYTAGVWTNHVLSGAELPAVGATQVTASWPFTTASVSSLTGRPLEKLTLADQPLLLRYAGNLLTGALIASPFDQTGADTVTGTMAQVNADQPLSIMLQPNLVAPRYAQVRPAVANLGMAWYVDAAPGGQYGSNTGPQLNAAPIAETDPPQVSAMYGNPFSTLGWQPLVTWTTNESRVYTPAGSMIGATLYSGMYQLGAPTAGASFTLPAGLPVTIRIGQTPLIVDGTTVTLDPAQAVDVSFDLEPGHLDNTLYNANVYALVPNAANTALQYQPVLYMSATSPHFVAPRALFQAGQLYTIRAVSVEGGYPALPAGDLTQRSLPISVSYLDSGAFEVAP
jgi:hypothetical protein